MRTLKVIILGGLKSGDIFTGCGGGGAKVKSETVTTTLVQELMDLDAAEERDQMWPARIIWIQASLNGIFLQTYNLSFKNEIDSREMEKKKGLLRAKIRTTSVLIALYVLF